MCFPPRLFAVLSVLTACLLATAQAEGQTPVNGDVLAFQSDGAINGLGWTLGKGVGGSTGVDSDGNSVDANGNNPNGVSNNSNGYVGTYVQVPASGGQVSFTVNAAGIESGTTWPDMTISVAGMNQSFSVNSATANTYTATFNLPGDSATDANGTYMVRVQLDNQTGTATTTPDLTVNSLQVAGATVSNSNSNTNALDAAQTYADKFRSGNTTLALTGRSGAALPAGTPVTVKLIDNAFNFADAVTGQTNSISSPNPAWLPTNAADTQDTTSPAQNIVTPSAGTYAAKYQAAVLANFNAIVPSNGGKWSNDEPTQGNVTMGYVDQLQQFAQENNLVMRAHNLLWCNQQPGFVNTLLTTALGGGSGAAAAKATLSADITSRINYYLDGTNVLTNAQRADAYSEMDVLNEAWHANADGFPNENYWKVYGASGIAGIYNQAAAAVTSAGAKTTLYLNEFNVLQFSNNPLITNAPNDNYANWYLAQVNDVRNAGGTVGGIGVQMYLGNSGLPATSEMMEALQNLSTTGLPISLSEFGTTSSSVTLSNAASVMTQTLTMLYGTPNATTIGFWGDLGGPNEPGALALYDSNWNLTAVGQAYEQWMSQWDTNLTVNTDANGDINFTGTYGTYQITADGQTEYYTFNQNGLSSLVSPLSTVPEPASASLALIFSAAALLRRRR